MRYIGTNCFLNVKLHGLTHDLTANGQYMIKPYLSRPDPEKTCSISHNILLGDVNSTGFYVRFNMCTMNAQVFQLISSAYNI